MDILKYIKMTKMEHPFPDFEAYFRVCIIKSLGLKISAYWCHLLYPKSHIWSKPVFLVECVKHVQRGTSQGQHDTLVEIRIVSEKPHIRKDSQLLKRAFL